MLEFHKGFPYLLRCYVLLVFYLPIYGLKWEVSKEDHLSLGQAFGEIGVTFVFLLSLLLPNAFFVSGYSASIPVITSLINGVLFYCAIIGVLVLEYPSAVMLMNSFASVHLLWSLSLHLKGSASRSVVMGGMVRRVCKCLCLLVPWVHYLLGAPLMLPPRDIVFVSMTLEIVGMLFNLLNALTLGLGKTMFL